MGTRHNPSPCVLECGTCGRCIEYQQWYDEIGYTDTQDNYDVSLDHDSDSRAQKKERQKYRKAARRRKAEWLDFAP
jgi:hypothetical protein